MQHGMDIWKLFNYFLRTVQIQMLSVMMDGLLCMMQLRKGMKKLLNY